MLAILSTHPIQYQVPLWQALARLRSAAGSKPVSFWGWRLTEDLAPRLKASNAKALWIQGWHVAGYWQAAAMAGRARAQLWMRGESNDLKDTPLLKSVAKRLVLGRLFHRVDQFLYIGQANRRLYEKYGVPGSKLHFAPYAVDNDRFARQAADLQSERAVIRRNWGIPEKAFCILFCGKFIAKKHPRAIIDVARALNQDQRISRVHLLFVGSGELGSDLRNLCSVVYNADSSHSVGMGNASRWNPPASFAGFLNQRDISKAYVGADCLVLPSDHGETWGLVVNEALASGLPCVASIACGCTEDLIAPNWPQRTFKWDDTSGLADAICDVHANIALGNERTAVSSYSFQQTCDQVARLYGAC